ncbi:hypothetical protein SJI45_01990 [Streptomyces sp. S399]|uniref:hypothetical protein n=1 Tax=Streptomyces sp. S399 TaxID=3096009 RepID=UPI002A816B84|nr:hypothetical protein [Streptomyces sp. S399]WPR50047.1 hypothetical protein SJI45_01990 [Streptomyces sp. S399]
MHRSFRKPLVIFTPKSLLRHKLAVSQTEDFLGDSHFMRILSDPSAPADVDVKRLVLCTGKVAYDLIEARDAAGDTNTAIVRLEQLGDGAPGDGCPEGADGLLPRPGAVGEDVGPADRGRRCRRRRGHVSSVGR